MIRDAELIIRSKLSGRNLKELISFIPNEALIVSHPKFMDKGNWPTPVAPILWEKDTEGHWYPWYVL